MVLEKVILAINSVVLVMKGMVLILPPPPPKVSTLHLFLLEVNVALMELTLSFTLKCEKKTQAEPFVKHFLQTLILKNMLTKL